jgi:hypothetical protein
VITKTQANLRWGRRAGPAVINETYGLELPGVGKRLGSSGASALSEVRGGGRSLFVRNEDGRAENGDDKKEAGSGEYGGSGL